MNCFLFETSYSVLRKNALASPNPMLTLLKRSMNLTTPRCHSVEARSHGLSNDKVIAGEEWITVSQGVSNYQLLVSEKQSVRENDRVLLFLRNGCPYERSILNYISDVQYHHCDFTPLPTLVDTELGCLDESSLEFHVGKTKPYAEICEESTGAASTNTFVLQLFIAVNTKDIQVVMKAAIVRFSGMKRNGSQQNQKYGNKQKNHLKRAASVC